MNIIDHLGMRLSNRGNRFSHCIIGQLGVTIFLLVIGISLACNNSNSAIKVAQRFDRNSDYGVMIDTATTSLKDNSVYYYLVRFEDANNDKLYNIIDSVHSPNTFRFCSDNGLYFIECNEVCCQLITTELKSPFQRDTVISLCDPKAKNIFGSFLNYSFLLKDSLLAFIKSRKPHVESSAFISTALVKIKTSGVVDTIAVFDSTAYPVFSGDGSELILNKYVSAENSDSTITSILIYNIKNDRRILPLPLDVDCNYAYKLTAGSPLYFMKYEQVGSGANVWKVTEGQQPEKVTSFEPPFSLLNFRLIADSIICIVDEQSDTGTVRRRIAFPAE